MFTTSPDTQDHEDRGVLRIGKMMKSGIKKAEAHWRVYNSPKAKEERFMQKAMQQARNGTLKYGKLSDAQVKRITERLALERNARQLGSTENPSYLKRIRSAVGEGVVRGIGQGTGAYIEERFRGRGRTTAEIKADKRKSKYESDQKIQKRKARNKVNQEYYEEAAKRGYDEREYYKNAAKAGDVRGLLTGQTNASRAKQLQAWKDRDSKEAERTKRQNAYHDTYIRTAAVNRAKSRVPDKTTNNAPSNQNNNGNSNNAGNGQAKPQLPVTVNVYGATGRVVRSPRTTAITKPRRRPRSGGRRN